MSKYRAIVFDLDGTAILNAHDAAASQRLIDAVTKYRGRTRLIAATGRTLFETLPIAKALGLTDPCIIMGGAVTIDPVTETVLAHTTLPPASVEAVLDHLKSWPNHVYVRGENAAAGHIDKAIIGQDAGLKHNVDMVCIDQITDHEFPALKAELERHPKILVTSAPSWNSGHFVIISHRDATKEHAIAGVLQGLNIPPAAAIGVGDGDNDLHLFAAVGLKVAMGNATPTLKAAADIIAPGVEDDGLAYIIEQYAT